MLGPLYGCQKSFSTLRSVNPPSLTTVTRASEVFSPIGTGFITYSWWPGLGRREAPVRQSPGLRKNSSPGHPSETGFETASSFELNRPAAPSLPNLPAAGSRFSLTAWPTSSFPDRRNCPRFGLQCVNPSCPGVNPCKRSLC